ncbi:MAG: V-type ATP synthase subunit F [Synergistaceae bacterium]|nr:V-type ATP synthase subunit F [Synergistaceae bacterium]
MSDNTKLPTAAIGDYEMVLPFQAVGIKPFIMPVQEYEAFPSLIDRLAIENYAVVFVQEELFIAYKQKIEEINDNWSVSVIPIPGIRGSKGAGLAAIRSSVEKAVGMDILAVK